MAKRFEMILDLITNFKSDKSQIDKVAKDIESKLKGINPDINLNSDKLKKQITSLYSDLSKLENGADSLTKAMKDIDIKLDSKDAKQALKDIEASMKSLDNIDLNPLSDALAKVKPEDLEKLQQGLKTVLSEASASAKYSIQLDPKALKEIENLKAKIRTVEKTKAKVTYDIESADKDIAKLNAKIKSIEDKKVSVQMNVDKADKDIATIKDKIAKIQDKKAKLEIDKNYATTEIDLINNKIQALNQTKVKVPIGTTGYEKLAQDFNKANQDTRTLLETQKTALAQMRLTGDKGSQAYKDLQKEIAKSEAELKKLNVAGEGLNDIGKSMTFTDKLAKVGLVTQGVDNIANALGTLSAPYKELDLATQSMRALGAEGKSMAPGLREAALVLSKDFPFAAGQFQSAMTNAIASGVKGGTDGIKTFAEVSAKLATGGGADIQAVVQGLGATLNAFGESSEEAGKYADWMFNTVNYGVVSIDELNSYLAQVTPTASAMGLSFDQVGGAIALMTQKGVPAARSMTKLNSLMIEMTKPSAEIINSLNAMGVSQQDFAKQIETQGLIPALETLQQGFGKIGKSATQAFSSTEASAAFNVLMGDVGMFKETMEQVSTTTGSTDEAYGAMAESINVRTAKMKANFEAYTIQLLDSAGVFGELAVVAGDMASQMSPLFSTLASSVTIFSGLGEPMKTLGSNLLKMIPGFAGAGTAGVASGTATQVAWLPLIAIIGSIAVAIAGIIAVTDWLIETDSERLEKLEGQNKALDEQIKLQDKRKNEIETNQQLITQYEELGAKTNRTAQEQKAFEEVTLKIAKAMPGTISSTKSYAENMDSLRTKSKELVSELENVNKNAEELKGKKINLDIAIAKQKEIINADDLLSELTSFGDIIGNKELEIRIDKIKASMNKEEADKALFNLKEEIFQSGKFQNADAETRAEIEASIKGLEESTIARINSYTAKIQSDSNKLGDAISNGISGGIDSDKVQSEIQAIANSTGVSIDEVTKTVQDRIKSNSGANIDNIFKRAVEINKEDISTEGIDELINKFKQAKTESDKQDIAEQIKKSAPEAVKYTKQIIDENGKLVSVYDVNIDKIHESANANKQRLGNEAIQLQEQYIKEIEKEGNSYDFNKNKMEELRKEIETDKKLGVDTSDLENQYNQLINYNQDFVNGLINGAIQWEAQGGDTNAIMETIAKTIGKSKNEVKAMVENQKKSVNEAKKQEQSVLKVGEAWAKAKQENQTQLTETETELAALIDKRKTEGKLSADEQKRYNELIEKGKKGAEELRRKEKSGEQANVLINGKQVERRQKEKVEEQSINETIQSRINILNEANEIELERLRVSQLERANLEHRALNEQDEIEMNRLKLQQSELMTKAIIEQGLALGKVKENSDGTFTFDTSADTKIIEMRDKLTKDLEELNKKRQDGLIKENAYKNERIKLQTQYEKEVKALNVQSLNDTQAMYLKSQSETLTLANQLNIQEINQLVSEYEKSITSMERELQEMQTNFDLNPQTKLDRVALNQQIQLMIDEIANGILRIKLLENISAEEKENRIRAEYDRLNKYQKQFNDNKQAIFQEALDKQNITDEQYLNNLKKTNYNAYYMMTKYYEDALRANDNFVASILKSNSNLNTKRIKQIDEDTQKELEALDKRYGKNNDLSNKERLYEEEKARIQLNGQRKKEQQEKEHNEKMLSFQSYQASMSKAIEDQKQLDELKRAAKSLSDKKALYEEEGLDNLTFDQKLDYSKITTQLDEMETTIKEKSIILESIMELAGKSISDGLTAMFAGDTEQAKQSLREFLSGVLGVLVQGIKNFLQATILQSLLEWFGWDKVDTPLSVKLIGIPVMHALISGVLNAIATPILSSITSFSTGGMVTKPTLSIIGDASKTGENNTEWVLTQKQLRQVTYMSASLANNLIDKRLQSIESRINNIQLQAVVKGGDLHFAVKTFEGRQNNRIR